MNSDGNETVVNGRKRDNASDSQLWEVLQRLFPDAREQRVAYLLFQCNLSPGEIFSFAPQEFSDVQEIYHLRTCIFQRILLHWDLIRYY